MKSHCLERKMAVAHRLDFTVGMLAILLLPSAIHVGCYAVLTIADNTTAAVATAIRPLRVVFFKRLLLCCFQFFLFFAYYAILSLMLSPLGSGGMLFQLLLDLLAQVLFLLFFCQLFQMFQ